MHMSNNNHIIETPDHWILPLAGYQVSGFNIGPAFEILLDKDGEFRTIISIANAFQFRDGETICQLDFTNFGEIWKAFYVYNHLVVNSLAFKTGFLQIEFSEGLAIGLEPSYEFEAWEIYDMAPSPSAFRV